MSVKPPVVGVGAVAEAVAAVVRLPRVSVKPPVVGVGAALAAVPVSDTGPKVTVSLAVLVGVACGCTAPMDTKLRLVPGDVPGLTAPIER